MYQRLIIIAVSSVFADVFCDWHCAHPFLQLELLGVLFEELHCPAVYLSEQAIMALYSYHLTTGVVGE